VQGAHLGVHRRGPTHGRADTVGTHEQLRLDPDHCAGRDVVAQSKLDRRFGAGRLVEDAEQCGSGYDQHVVVVRIEHAGVDTRQHASPPIAQRHAPEQRAEGTHVRAESQPVEAGQPVRGQRERCTGIARIVAALQHDRLGAGPRQPQGRGQTSDATSDDRRPPDPHGVKLPTGERHARARSMNAKVTRST
jgi:hypothetical protein